MSHKITIEDVVAEYNRPITINEHGCWLWMGATDKKGYARFGGALVHPVTCRWAGKVRIGPDAELCHTCPNKNCINPDHFYVGTHKQNMNDDQRGAIGRTGQLTEAQIESINEMLDRNVPKYIIAHMHGVSPAWVTKFLKGDLIYAKPRTSSK